MGYYAVFPFFAGTLAIVLLASTPLLVAADTPPTTVRARVRTIDGLRGFLALSVFFHHAAVYHQYLLTGRWALPPSRFYANLGEGGVAMFFMITGFLFWMQMLKLDGKPNFFKLYIGRLFRIFPLYLLLAVIVILSVGYLTEWRLAESPLKLAKEVFKWLAGGVFYGGELNNFVDTHIISAGVTWTLRYEWLFYASLLCTSYFARKFISGSLLPLMGLLLTVLVLSFHPAKPLACALMFFVGMTSASTQHAGIGISPKTPRWVLSVGAICSITVVMIGFNGIYQPMPILILGFAFGLIVSGATVFGLLVIRPARRLGDISYGIYLLQGPTLFLAFGVPFARSFAKTSALGHWLVVMMAAVTLVVLATATHVLVERPGVKAGHHIWAKISSMRERRRSDSDRNSKSSEPDIGMDHAHGIERPANRGGRDP